MSSLDFDYGTEMDKEELSADLGKTAKSLGIECNFIWKQNSSNIP